MNFSNPSPSLNNNAINKKAVMNIIILINGDSNGVNFAIDDLIGGIEYHSIHIIKYEIYNNATPTNTPYKYEVLTINSTDPIIIISKLNIVDTIILLGNVSNCNHFCFIVS